MKVVSIDQNSHCLWDTLPKLHALSESGKFEVTHLVEDIDVAFTALGSKEGCELRISPERFYHTGGSDWGASLFYTDFLGKVPVDIRQWEKLLGVKLKQLAKSVGSDVAALYGKYSVSDNWMLIGPSFVGGQDHHRLIGDLGVSECRPFVEWMIERAHQDTLKRFPAEQCVARSNEWFAAERRRAADLMDACKDKNLAEFYAAWLGEDFGGVKIGQCSEMFWLGKGSPPLVDFFVREYDRAAGLYNRAVELANLGLHKLSRRDGELPFYAVSRKDGRYVRCECFLRDGSIFAGDMDFAVVDGLPVESMWTAGVECVAGKAMLLVLQARMLGGALALPYHGSLYMPAVHEFEKLLRNYGILRGEIPPVLRVRFRLLDRMRQLGDDVVLNLPEHLRGVFETDELPASRFAEILPEVISSARERLRSFEDESGRENWLRNTFPDQVRELESLEIQRRELAAKDPKSQAVRNIWNRCKELQKLHAEAMLEQVHRDWQTAEIDFYDSRGAILPWCVAMGGAEFYKSVITSAEIYQERP